LYYFHPVLNPQLGRQYSRPRRRSQEKNHHFSSKTDKLTFSGQEVSNNEIHVSIIQTIA